jgi:hypothetical protein
MFTRSETLIVTAAVALAMVPRFEAKVEQFTKTHRTEIQMAMNELQGKPAIPFAAPETVPAVEGAPAAEEPQLASMVEEDQAMQADELQAHQVLNADELRAHLATLSPQIKAATRLQLARLQPELANLRLMAGENRGAFRVYRLKAKRCPAPPAAPAIPALESLTIETGSLP